jgi:hypothetical protein
MSERESGWGLSVFGAIAVLGTIEVVLFTVAYWVLS